MNSYIQRLLARETTVIIASTEKFGQETAGEKKRVAQEKEEKPDWELDDPSDSQA
jgi:hypothetical protein